MHKLKGLGFPRFKVAGLDRSTVERRLSIAEFRTLNLKLWGSMQGVQWGVQCWVLDSVGLEVGG